MVRLFLSVSKGKELRFLGHLDFLRAMERAVTRAGLPAAYSEGFNPHMRLSFDSALGVGIAADPVYMDLRLEEAMSLPELQNRLQEQLPRGIQIHQIKEIPLQSPKLTTFFNEDAYEMEGPVSASADPAKAEEAISYFNSLPSFSYTRVTPKKTRVMDVKPMIIEPLDLKLVKNRAYLKFSLVRSNLGTVQPKDIWKILSESFGLPWKPDEFICSRTGAYFRKDGVKKTPFSSGS